MLLASLKQGKIADILGLLKSKLFWLAFFSILIAGFIIRVLPALGNNFYFTMDQGDDAVHTREILFRHQILLRGPETGIKGVYHGSGWYYFISIGYWLFGGHPFGSIFMLILLNLALTAYLMFEISKRVSPKLGLLVGGSLQFFWWFYDSSRYGFNPFPTVALSFFTILALIEFLNYRQKRYFVLAAIPVGLAYHTEIAFAVPLTIFLVSVGIWAIMHKFIVIRIFVVAMLILSIFWIPRFIFEIRSGFSQSDALRNEIANPNGVFSRTNVKGMFSQYTDLIGKSILPSNSELGFVVFVLLTTVFFTKRYAYKNIWRGRFAILLLWLIFVSWVIYSSNLGWKAWHTTSIPILVFVSVVLMISNLPQKLAVPLLVMLLFIQANFFFVRYKENFYPTKDASLLVNEIGAVDWVYKESGQKGFYVYNYLPSVLDYPYQYLFWWYGIKTYGYVPCEFSSFPDSPKIFIRGDKYYEEPKRECDKTYRYLIIEPDKNTFVRQHWIDQITKNTELLKEVQIGTITVQKRKMLSLY